MKLLLGDYLIGIGIGLNLASRFITNYLTSSISGLATTANAIEANPTGIAKSCQYQFLYQCDRMVHP